MPRLMTTLPANHPLRIELNDEVHARPPEALKAPLRATLLALLADGSSREAEWEMVCALARRFGVAPPPAGRNHFSADLGPFRLKWERHTEFSRLKFIVAGAESAPFAEPAIAAVPADWVAALPGRVLVATHATILPDAGDALDHERIATQSFAGNPVVGSLVAGGKAVALTDFRIHADGFGRLLIRDRGLAPRQAGRLLQRVLEIDIYRMLALLAFPVARDLSPALAASERELATIATMLAAADTRSEPMLLDRLTRLQAAIESKEADSHYRFGAAAAYYELVQRRIGELREERIDPLPLFQEFMERRLAPAMNTCRAISTRLESLSRRVSRASQLLSTRIESTREVQNQSLLESMDRRAELQLRLQSTVEGLSVAAVTYYVVGLVNYAAKGLNSLGLPVDSSIVTVLSIPLVAVVVWRGIRRVTRKVAPGHSG
jgi:uncharacterized membrane-anchored protein